MSEALLLGTPLRRGAPAHRALLISDLHVPADGGLVVEHLDAALAAARQRDAALFVLGDLFDSYVSARQVGVGIWRDIAARFLDAVLTGTRVVVLVGNRDFLLGPEFVAQSRVELVHGGYRVELGGVDTLLLHGDELCQNDLPYQRAKRWLRSAPVRWLARRLPLSFAERVAERARKKSRKVVGQGDPARFLPSQRAIATAFAAGPQRLVFGHIHRRATGTYAAGRYFVLPAFDEHGVGLWFEAAGASGGEGGDPEASNPASGRWLRCSGASVETLDQPGPGPCPWSA